MPDINKANRQVCDVDIRDLKTMKPFMFFETANTTTQNISSDSVFAMAKGTKRIGFANPMDGTATIETQVYPFRLYSLMTDGVVESTAMYPERKVIKCETAGKLTIPEVSGGTIDSVFVFAEDDFGGTEIEGSFSGSLFTPTETNQIAIGKSYEVGYMVTKTSGVRKISFNNNKLPKAYYISMNTVEKDENEVLTPYKIILYKAQPQRNFELSQSSEGEPASLTLTFDLLSNKDGDFVDMVEIEEEE